MNSDIPLEHIEDVAENKDFKNTLIFVLSLICIILITGVVLLLFKFNIL